MDRDSSLATWKRGTTSGSTDRRRTEGRNYTEDIWKAKMDGKQGGQITGHMRGKSEIGQAGKKDKTEVSRNSDNPGHKKNSLCHS